MTARDKKKKVTAFVLKAYRAVYKAKQTDSQILKIDPNGFDREPAAFYEQLSDEYGVEGLRGTVAQTIGLIVARWDDGGGSFAGYGPYPLIGRYLEGLPYAPNANKATLDQELLGYKRIESEYNRLKKAGATEKELTRSLFLPEFQMLKEQARRALERKHLDQIVKHARKRKVEDIEASVVKRILEHIVNAR